MTKLHRSYISILLTILFLFSACAAPEASSRADFPLPYPDEFADVMSITDGKVRAFDLAAGVSYDEFVGEIFSEDALDLQFYSDTGEIRIKEPLQFSEAGDEEWIVSFYFADNRLTRIAVGVTFLNTPLADACAAMADLRDSYRAQFGNDVYFREQGPSFEELADGDMDPYFAEWILDEGGGAHISADIRDDLKTAGITKQDFCLEVSVIIGLS